MKSLIFVILAGSCLAAEPLKGVFNQYVELQTALAQDHFDHAKMVAKKLNKSLAGVDHKTVSKDAMKAWMTEKPKLMASTKAAATATDIKVLRTQFDLISKSIIALGEASGTFGFHQFHCGMAFDGEGADWLQKGDSTLNPYFGSAMLKCGAMVKAAKKEMHQGHNHGHSH